MTCMIDGDEAAAKLRCRAVLLEITMCHDDLLHRGVVIDLYI